MVSLPIYTALSGWMLKQTQALTADGRLITILTVTLWGSWSMQLKLEARKLEFMLRLICGLKYLDQQLHAKITRVSLFGMLIMIMFNLSVTLRSSEDGPSQALSNMLEHLRCVEPVSISIITHDEIVKIKIYINVNIEPIPNIFL